jgi:cytochrome c-type biogenesis protein CcmE
MAKSVWFAIAAGFVGLGVMVAAFVVGASPYVTIAEARTMRSDGLHIAGDIVAGSLHADPQSQITRFRLRDGKGDTVAVDYRGTPPANMGNVTKVVVVGGMSGDTFHARKLQIKCPSKYDEAPTATDYGKTQGT